MDLPAPSDPRPYRPYRPVGPPHVSCQPPETRIPCGSAGIGYPTNPRRSALGAGPNPPQQDPCQPVPPLPRPRASRPTGWRSDPGEGPTSPREGPTSPREGPTSPGEGPAGPREGPTSPGEGPAGPGEGPTSPREGPTSPGEGPTRSEVRHRSGSGGNSYTGPRWPPPGFVHYVGISARPVFRAKTDPVLVT